MASALSVLLFVPNIIGYLRVVLAIISFYFIIDNFYVAVICYLTSSFLDALDGHAARLLNQSSKVGAMLDMLTDRAGTLGLVMALGVFYPHYLFWLQLSAVLDIVAHWIFMHSTILTGRTSHKTIDLSSNAVLRVYYTSRPVLFIMCACNELFYASLYSQHFVRGYEIGGRGCWQWIAIFTAPIALTKAFISLVHLIVAFYNIAAIDAAERNGMKSY